MKVRFSKDELLFLTYDSEGRGRDPEANIRSILREVAESEEAFCLDPKRSAFRAWLLARAPTTRTERCRRPVKGVWVGGWCSAHLANFAAEGIEVAADGKVKASKPAKVAA